MVPATMTSLRNMKPLSSTAAILPGYELAFDIPTGAWLEPSAASVRRRRVDTDSTTSSMGISNHRGDEGGAPATTMTAPAVVHGVLYQLSETDFARLGSSEGVPAIYVWEKCRVVPYQGDSHCAGRTALAENSHSASASSGVEAFVLTASPLLRRIATVMTTRSIRRPDKKDASSTVLPDIPPSSSYLQILRDGAAYWQMDEDYQAMLAAVPVNPSTPGIANWILQTAQRFRPSSVEM